MSRFDEKPWYDWEREKGQDQKDNWNGDRKIPWWFTLDWERGFCNMFKVCFFSVGFSSKLAPCYNSFFTLVALDVERWVFLIG